MENSMKTLLTTTLLLFLLLVSCKGKDKNSACKGEKEGAVCKMTAGEMKSGSCDMGQKEKGGHPKIETQKEDVGRIAKVDGGITLADLFAHVNDYQGKTVLIRGKVVKINYGILNKTWIHIQDGSGDDLTVTTTSSAPKKGDIVIVKGVFAKDKDIGMGYQFKGIIEDAQVTIEK